MKKESDIEISLVIPCLNEADTLAKCLDMAKKSLAKIDATSEIIVADNNSTDESAEIARKNGARVTTVLEPGYGSAIMKGISISRGKYIVMGDADENHDFIEIPRFIAKLTEGFDLVQGCRFPSGGGTIMPGSMSFLHRKVGNPFFTMLTRTWFKLPVHDVYCGFRAFTRTLYDSLNQRCTGMEFAPEMIIKAGFKNAKIAEIPITHHPDGRINHDAHLRTFRDGWRTLRFFLLYSPRWLFLLPGVLLVSIGVIFYVLGITIFSNVGTTFLLRNFIFGILAILCGYQSILFAVLTKVFAINESLLPEDPRLDRFFDLLNLERGLLLSFISFSAGVVLLVFGIYDSKPLGFEAIQLYFLGAVLVALGFQTTLFGFFTSILGMRRK